MSELLAAQVYLVCLKLLGLHVAKRRELDPGRLIGIVETWTA